MFIEAKDDGGCGDNWTTGAIKSCKAPVKSSLGFPFLVYFFLFILGRAVD